MTSCNILGYLLDAVPYLSQRGCFRRTEASCILPELGGVHPYALGKGGDVDGVIVEKGAHIKDELKLKFRERLPSLLVERPHLLD